MPDGRLETFRLYFVDPTESRSRGERSDQQAAYFGLTRAGHRPWERGRDTFALTRYSRRLNQDVFVVQASCPALAGFPREDGPIKEASSLTKRIN